jgi:hypothetical protein
MATPAMRFMAKSPNSSRERRFIQGWISDMNREGIGDLQMGPINTSAGDSWDKELQEPISKGELPESLVK